MIISRNFQLTKHENRKISAPRSFVSTFFSFFLNCPCAQCLGKLLFALCSPFTNRAITNIQCGALFLQQSYYNIIQMQTHSKGEEKKKTPTDKRILGARGGEGGAGGWRGNAHTCTYTHTCTLIYLRTPRI